MGAYRDIELDFIDRTMTLIHQYYERLREYPFEQQYNYTLLINCLLGLIVLPKERSLNQIPDKERLVESVKQQMGLSKTKINSDIKTLKQLLIGMRNSVAHFHIRIESLNNQQHIDQIIFADPDKHKDYVVATFVASELLPFLQNYTNWLKENIIKSRKARKAKALIKK